MDKEQGQGQLTVYLTTFLTNLVFTHIFYAKTCTGKRKHILLQYTIQVVHYNKRTITNKNQKQTRI